MVLAGISIVGFLFTLAALSLPRPQVPGITTGPGNRDFHRGGGYLRSHVGDRLAPAALWLALVAAPEGRLETKPHCSCGRLRGSQWTYIVGLFGRGPKSKAWASTRAGSRCYIVQGVRFQVEPHAWYAFEGP